MAGNAVLNDIATQFDIWQGLIEDMDLLIKDVSLNFQVREYDGILFIGAGSSYYVAQAAAAAFHMFTGEDATAHTSSDIVFFHRYFLNRKKKYVVVVFSRSGETTETIEALNILRNSYRMGAVAISCNPESTLCASCEMSLPVKNCINESKVMTKSFTGMLFVSYMFASAYGERHSNINYLEQLAREGRSSFEMQRRIIDEIVASVSLERTTILGAGPMFPLAAECALKLDETALLRTKVSTPMEMRHGPHLAVGPHDFVVLLQSESAGQVEMAVLSEMRQRGAKTLIIAEKKEPVFDHITDYFILAGRGFPEECRGILYVPFMQYMACTASIARGLDPDDIPGMQHVVTF